MKKTILTLIAAITCFTCNIAFAQDPSDFIVIKMNPTPFYVTQAIHPLDYRIFFSDDNNFHTIDSGAIDKMYSYTNTGSHPYVSTLPPMSIDDLRYYFPAENPYMLRKYKDHYYCTGRIGIMEFEESKDSITILNVMYQDKKLCDFYFTDDYIYLLHYPVPGKRIFEKINRNAPELADTIDIIGSALNKLLFDGKKFYWYSGDNVELSIDIDKEFKNENVERYDFLTIKTKTEREIYPDAHYENNNQDIIKLFAVLQNVISLKNDQVRVAFVRKNFHNDTATLFWDKGYTLETPLYICENGIWDTIDLQAGYNLLRHPSALVIYNYLGLSSAFIGNTGIFKWSDEEIVMQFRIPNVTNYDNPNPPDTVDLRTLLIYNITTKEWRKFIIPEELLLPHKSIRSFVNWNGTPYFMSGQSKITNDYTLFKYKEGSYIEDTPITPLPSFKVFPNPAKDLLTIALAIPDVPSVVTISNEAGQEIFTQPIVNTQDIDISAFPTGVYFIKVGDAVEKLVVE